MTTRYLQLRGRKHRLGFTLIEMSSAMAVMMILGIALLVMLNQHILFLSMFQRQSFLTVEAPTIGNLIGRMVNQADYYFVYSDKANATGGGRPQMDGKAVRLFFKSANQVTTSRVIAVEPGTGGNSLLRFYGWQDDGTQVDWTISDRARDAAFASSDGILNITLEGPNGEQITYGGGVK